MRKWIGVQGDFPGETGGRGGEGAKSLLCNTPLLVRQPYRFVTCLFVTPRFACACCSLAFSPLSHTPSFTHRVCDDGGDRVWHDPAQQCASHPARILTERTAGVLRVEVRARHWLVADGVCGALCMTLWRLILTV